MRRLWAADADISGLVPFSGVLQCVTGLAWLGKPCWSGLVANTYFAADPNSIVRFFVQHLPGGMAVSPQGEV